MINFGLLLLDLCKSEEWTMSRRDLRFYETTKAKQEHLGSGERIKPRLTAKRRLPITLLFLFLRFVRCLRLFRKSMRPPESSHAPTSLRPMPPAPSVPPLHPQNSSNYSRLVSNHQLYRYEGNSTRIDAKRIRRKFTLSFQVG